MEIRIVVEPSGSIEDLEGIVARYRHEEKTMGAHSFWFGYEECEGYTASWVRPETQADIEEREREQKVARIKYILDAIPRHEYSMTVNQREIEAMKTELAKLQEGL